MMRVPEFVRRFYFRFFGSYKRQWDLWARNPVAARVAIAPGARTSEIFDESGKEVAAKLLHHIGANDRILEVGCGMGRVLKHLAPHCLEAHGVDVSPRMVALARKHCAGSPRIFIQRCNGSDLSNLSNSHFDMVFCIYVLQHLEREHAVQYLWEMARVLKEGGVLICEVPNLLFPRNLETYLTGCRKSRHFSIARSRFYTPDEIRAVVNGIGFEVVTCAVDSEVFWVARKNTAVKLSPQNIFESQTIEK